MCTLRQHVHNNLHMVCSDVMYPHYAHVLALRIGFMNAIHTMSEVGGYANSVILLKEDDIQTEQSFSVEVSAQFLKANLPALQVTSEEVDGDYAFTDDRITFLVLPFPSSLQMQFVNITIFDDDLAEGVEAFLLCSRSSVHDGSPSYHFPIDTYTETTIVIEDNDSKLNAQEQYLMYTCIISSLLWSKEGRGFHTK